MLPNTDPIHKVTIIPRGRALGLTQQLPIEEKHTHSKGYLINRMCILLGGRAAEKLVFDDITTGAGNDIEHATALARKMVCEWGMSDMGPLTFGKKEEQIFLGREIAQHRDFSEDTAIKIDKEVRDFVMEANEIAQKVLNDNIQVLHDMAHALLEKETLVQEDIENIIAASKGEPPPKRDKPTKEAEPLSDAVDEPETAEPDADAAEEPETGDPQPQE
jgi:cell division protease FtsH